MQETQEILRFGPWVGKIPWRRDGNPLQYSCLENAMDKGAWWVIVHGVSKSQIWLKWLSTCVWAKNGFYRSIFAISLITEKTKFESHWSKILSAPNKKINWWAFLCPLVLWYYSRSLIVPLGLHRSKISGWPKWSLGFFHKMEQKIWMNAVANPIFTTSPSIGKKPVNLYTRIAEAKTARIFSPAP